MRVLIAWTLFLVSISLPGLHAQEDEQRELRIYDVRSIVSTPTPVRMLARPQGHLVFWDEESDLSIPLFGPRVFDPVVTFPKDESPRPSIFDPDTLVDLTMRVIVDLVGEENEDSFDLSYREGFLFVNVGATVQKAVDQFLTEHERRASLRYLVECLVLPPSVLDEIFPTWREVQRDVPAEVFDRAFLSSEARLLSTVAVARQWVTGGTRQVQALLSDVEINQTGVIPVSNPVTRSPEAGDWLHARAWPIGDSNEVLIDLALGRFGIDVTRQALGSSWNELDLPTSTERLFSLATIASTGKPMIAAELGGDNAQVVLLRVTRQTPEPKKDAPAVAKDGEFYQEIYDPSVLLRSSALRRWWPSGFWAESEADGYGMIKHADGLLDFLRELTPQSEEEEGSIDFESGVVYVRGPDSVHKNIDKLLRWQIDRATQLSSVRLELVEISRLGFAALRSAAEDDWLLQPGWRALIKEDATAKIESFGLSGIAGESHALRNANLHSLVTDVSNVSGGTGFSIIERVDPVVSTCGEGTEFRLRVDFMADEKRARVRLQGIDAELGEIRSVTSRFPAFPDTHGRPSMMQGQAPRSPSLLSQMVKEVKLMLPSQSLQYWAMQRDIPLDRDVILHADAPEGGVTRVLIARVARIR